MSTKMIKYLMIAFFSIFIFSGCSFFNIGKEQGYCEEHGCDYSDAGVCGDVYKTYESRYKDLDKSYRDINCNKCEGRE